MPTHPLPENPSLENLKKRAKGLRDAVRAENAEGVARVREFHPRAERALVDFALADAQLVVARGFGFASWARLKEHLAVVERFAWDPSAPPVASAAEGEAAARAWEFVRLACLVYGEWNPSRALAAERLLAEHPECVEAELAAAAAAGDVAALRAALDREPALLDARVGPLGWEPLLYACYSRVRPGGGRSTLATARELLERGADANAGFLWCGNVPPFTALTGAFGEGEDGNNQPPHPERDALARLLLEAGADPNDEQTLYNRHFRQDDGHLRLLFEYGLGTERASPWPARLGDRLHSPRRMLIEELWSAARKGFRARVELLLEHGVEVDAPGMRDGRTPYEAALMTGNRKIAELLAAHGARTVPLEPVEAFAAAALAGDGDEARALLRRDPGLLAALGLHGRLELLHRAVEADRRDGVRLLAELGFELSGTTAHRGVGVERATTPLHNAAWAGNLAMVDLLVGLGADARRRDPRFDATPLGWALHNRQREVVEYLAGRLDPNDPAHAEEGSRAAEFLRAVPEE